MASTHRSTCRAVTPSLSAGHTWEPPPIITLLLTWYQRIRHRLQSHIAKRYYFFLFKKYHFSQTTQSLKIIYFSYCFLETLISQWKSDTTDRGKKVSNTILWGNKGTLNGLGQWYCSNVTMALWLVYSQISDSFVNNLQLNLTSVFLNTQ